MAAPGTELPPGSFDSRVPTVIGVIAFTLTVATAAVSLRIYTRKFIVNQVGIDDYFAILALLITYGSGIAIGCMTKFGLGKHIWTIDIPSMLPLYLRSFYVSIVMYCAALFAIKMTFLFQYYRVLAVQNLRKVFLAAIVIVGAWSLSQLLIGIFICSPIQGFWDSTVQAKCIPNYPQFYINAAGNIVTDIVVFALPLPIIGKLQLAKPQKIMLLGIFSLGFFTVAISVLRIKYLKLFEDATWENVESSSWSIAELSSGITCACLPTLRPFVSRHFPALGTLAGRSKASTDPSTGNSLSKKSFSKKTTPSQLEQGKPPSTTDSQNGSTRRLNQYGSYELKHYDSADLSEDVVGLGSVRAAQSEDDAKSSMDRDAMMGLKPTVKSKVETTGPSRLPQPGPVHMSEADGIQVRRDVYQTRQRGH